MNILVPHKYFLVYMISVCRDMALNDLPSRSVIAVFVFYVLPAVQVLLAIVDVSDVCTDVC